MGEFGSGAGRGSGPQGDGSDEVGDADDRGGGPTEPAVTVDGVTTYVHCPRRYEFAHRYALADDDDPDPAARRRDLLRTAICDALRRAEPAALEAAARDRLIDLWGSNEGGEPSSADRSRYHSIEQARHERRALEATLAAYVDAIGEAHARGIERLREAACPAGDGAATADTAPLVGPDLALPSAVQVPGRDDPVRLEAAVDYVFEAGPEGPLGDRGDGDRPADAEGDLVAVRFRSTLAGLGLLRYRSEWDGDVAARFEAHADPDDERYEPDPVGALLETAAVLEGLREVRDRRGLGDRRCRYVVVPLADRSNASVNWARGTVETSLEPVDLTEPFLDHRTYGMTFEHRNEAVEDRLEAVVGAIAAGRFDPRDGDRWEAIDASACDECAYTVCCGDALAAEVRFDG